MRVLIVEDHAPTRDLLVRALARDGHVVTTADSLATARDVFDASELDLVVLDLGLPDGSGLALCRALRGDDVRVPILILTAHGAVAQRVEALDAGADDFLAKPFALAELRARVRALGRRGPLPRGLAHRIGDVALDLAARRATVNAREVPLTAREWALLELLASRGARVVSRGEILDAVWGDDSPQASASLDVIVARVRRKLGAACLRTVRGEGYTLGDGRDPP